MDFEEIREQLLAEDGLLAIATGDSKFRLTGNISGYATALSAGTLLCFAIDMLSEAPEADRKVIAECFKAGFEVYKTMKEKDVSEEALEVCTILVKDGDDNSTEDAI